MIIESVTWEFMNFYRLVLAQAYDDFWNWADILTILDQQKGLSLHSANKNDDLNKTQILTAIPSQIVTADSLGNPKLETDYRNQQAFDAVAYPIINTLADCVIEQVDVPPDHQISSAAWNAFVLQYLGFLWLYGYRAWDDPNSFWDDPIAIWG